MARMTIELPDDIVEIVADTAAKESIPKTEVIRRIFAVLKIARREEEKGNSLGIVNGDKVIGRLIGI